jgi:hypothetical protein
MSAAATRAPAAAKASALARPMPETAPVTSTNRPVKSVTIWSPCRPRPASYQRGRRRPVGTESLSEVVGHPQRVRDDRQRGVDR